MHIINYDFPHFLVNSMKQGQAEAILQMQSINTESLLSYSVDEIINGIQVNKLNWY